jgi:hypothetical protein
MDTHNGHVLADSIRVRVDPFRLELPPFRHGLAVAVRRVID